MFLVLVLVVSGVCTINLSSLNLTENEQHLLYVGDDANFSQEKQSPSEEQSIDLDFEKDFGEDSESKAKKDAWDKFSNDLENDGVTFDNFNSEDEALNLTKKIYEKR